MQICISFFSPEGRKEQPRHNRKSEASVKEILKRGTGCRFWEPDWVLGRCCGGLYVPPMESRYLLHSSAWRVQKSARENSFVDVGLALAHI